MTSKRQLIHFVFSEFNQKLLKTFRCVQSSISNGSDSSILARERLYNRRSAEDDDFSRSSSRRTSRYRSKLEKARKEFLSSDPNNTPGWYLFLQYAASIE